MSAPPPSGPAGPSLARDPWLWASALLTAALCAPYFRYMHWLGDEGVVLNGADRILKGDALYGDFFEFLPPGSFLLVATWMQVVGEGLASVRVLAIAVLAAIAALTYLSARLASGHRLLAAAMAVSWAVLVQGVWTVNNHHWLTTAASMAASAALLWSLQHPSGRHGGLFLAGACAGTAAMITSTRGALLCVAVLAVALARPGWGALRAAAGGILVFPAGALAFLAASGTLAAAVHDVIVAPISQYGHIQKVSFGAFAAPHQTPSVVFFPLTFVLTGVTAIVGGDVLRRDPVFRAALGLAIVGLLGTFPRPDLAHINFTAPLACPLFALVATRALPRLPRQVRLGVSGVAIGLCVIGVGWAAYKKVMPMATVPMQKVTAARGVFIAPQGPSVAGLAALVEQIARTPRDDGFFFYPYAPMLPYLTDRHHVGTVDVMVPGYTSARQYRDACASVVRRAQWVVIDRVWSHPNVLRALFPGLRDPDPPEKRALEAALIEAFPVVAHASPQYELRRRAGPASEAACGAS